MSLLQWAALVSGLSMFLIPVVLRCIQRRRSTSIAPLTHTIASVSYTPYSNRTSIEKRKRVTIEQIRRELSSLCRHVSHIRTYSVSGAQAWVPRIAESMNLRVSLGIWIGSDEQANAREIARARVMLRKHKNIVRVIVGNETLFRHDVSIDRLQAYITEVKAMTTLPVTTAELWHTWLSYPALAKCTDEITIHILPFWEGVDLTEAVDHTLSALNEVHVAFPEHKVFVGEVGWPSSGHAINTVPADAYQQAEYLRSLTTRLTEKNVDYNVIEAFDQRWKRSEGTVGAYWGLFKRNGTAKFILTGGTSIPCTGVRVFLYDFFRSTAGKALMLITAITHLGMLAEQGWHALSALPVSLGGFLLVVWVTWCTTVLAISLHEMVERYLMPRQPRFSTPSQETESTAYKVAIHVACRNEPADMVIHTLSSLSRLDYGDYEVHVLDNNTKQAALWRPVQAHCQALGSKFNFWHVDELSGFKGGALNFLLDKTSDDVDLIAVIDSDYQVEPDWLNLVYFFHDPHVAVVQSPQDYRDQTSLFKRLCYFEYKSFFNTGMLIRNNFNAIILHGTMTLIRASVLKTLRWSERCVCEDAELGVRILQQGHKMKYLPVSYGKGLMPDSFSDYKRQRVRWVTGAIQILIEHARALFLGQATLSLAQRYQFVMGWMHWIAQAGGLLLTVGLIAWSLLAATSVLPQSEYPLLVSVSLSTACLLTLLMQAVFYVRYSPDGNYNAWLSVLASQALNHAVACAVWHALRSRSVRFNVTPKQTLLRSFRQRLSASTGEALIFVGLMSSACTTIVHAPFTVSALCWSAMLLLRSLPYGLSVFMSVLSARHSLGAVDAVANSSGPEQGRLRIRCASNVQAACSTTRDKDQAI